MHKYQIFIILDFILAAEHIYRLQNWNKNCTVNVSHCACLSSAPVSTLQCYWTVELERSFLDLPWTLKWVNLLWYLFIICRELFLHSPFIWCKKCGQLFTMSTEKPNPVGASGRKCTLDWCLLSSLLISDDKTQWNQEIIWFQHKLMMHSAKSFQSTI